MAVECMTFGGVNPTLLELIFEEPIEGYRVLDVGCGAGALSFILAKRAGRVVGIDISKEAVRGACRIAEERGFSNTAFKVMDADKDDYRLLGRIDMVVSNLCMSDEIVKQSYGVLPLGRVFAFACFHSEHLIEGGRRSGFSYTRAEMKEVLVKTGFTVEYLEVETLKMPFEGREKALRILGPRTVQRWEKDGRLEHLLNFIKEGGRHLTKSTLVGKARKRIEEQ